MLLERLAVAGVDTRAVASRELARLCPRGRVERFIGLVAASCEAGLDALIARGGALWLLVGTAYPGNAGFVIRTAEGSGASGAIIDAPFDRDQRRDAGRASMRADRYLPVRFESAERVVARALESGRRVIAIEDSGSRAPREVDLRGDVLFVVGGEAEGIPRPLLGRATEVVRLPMFGFIPSYNLQAAMAMVVAERLRQEDTAHGQGT